MTTRVSVLAVGLVVVLGACKDPLTAKNYNNPDVRRVFSSPAAIEQTIGSGFQQCRNTEKLTDMNEQLAVMSGESYSALNNFNMGPRDAIPRAPILNTPSASQALNGNYSGWARNARLVANAMKVLDDLIEENGTALPTKGGDLRARAIGFFNMACNLGWLSLAYDSTGVIDHIAESDFVPELSSYQDVNAAALAYLDSAVAMANTAGSEGSGGFPAEASWFGGNGLSKDDFVRLARSYKARFRAGVARSAAERAAVNWAAVAADAEAGITSDFIVAVGGSTGWNIGPQSSQNHVSAAWHQHTLMYNGFSDVSGVYAAWLAKPILLRDGDITMVTPDLRWPQGATQAAQRTYSAQQPADHTSMPYNWYRTEWSPGDPWGESWYANYRYKYIRNNSSSGPFPDMLKAEMDIIAAEAYLRTGNMTKAMEKLNVSRVAAGLPAITGATSATSIVPGGANCVPKVPSFDASVVKCGTIFEAMKYEWRNELAFNYLGAWFFAGRGWEDLVVNTPLYYPVPTNELEARYGSLPAVPYYNIGGGGVGSAPLGTYKF